MHVGDRARKETDSQTCNVSNTVRIGPQVPLEEAKRRSIPYMNCYESFQTQVWPCRGWLISKSGLRINLKVEMRATQSTNSMSWTHVRTV